MTIKGFKDEDFVNYRKPSMFIAAPSCTFKCVREYGGSCQNSSLAHEAPADVGVRDLIERYLANPITKAIVFGGLEPFDQYGELFDFIAILRGDYKCHDDIVIYTGYNPDEIDGEIRMLSILGNIVVKFGRYIPGQTPHLDEVLGVMLASDNQYAQRI